MAPYSILLQPNLADNWRGNADYSESFGSARVQFGVRHPAWSAVA